MACYRLSWVIKKMRFLQLRMKNQRLLYITWKIKVYFWTTTEIFKFSLVREETFSADTLIVNLNFIWKYSLKFPYIPKFWMLERLGFRIKTHPDQWGQSNILTYKFHSIRKYVRYTATKNWCRIYLQWLVHFPSVDFCDFILESGEDPVKKTLLKIIPLDTRKRTYSIRNTFKNISKNNFNTISCGVEKIGN